MQNTVSSTRSLEERIIEHLESLQLIGKMPKVVSASHEEVSIEITKHGLKISSAATSFVKLRIPLLELVFITTFCDGFGKSNVVFVEKSSTPMYQLHLLQLVNSTCSTNLCNELKNVFVEAEEISKLIEVVEPPSPSLS